MKRILIVLAVLLVLFAVFLPTIVSTDGARSFLLGQINARSDGTVTVEKWSFQWRGSQALRGVTVRDEDERLLFDVDSVEVSAGLLELIRSYTHPGRVAVQAPRLFVYLPEPVDSPVPPPPGQAPSAPPQERDSAPSPKKAPPLPAPQAWSLPDIYLDLSITHAEAYVVRWGADPEPLIQNLVVSAHAQGAANAIKYDAQFVPGAGDGHVTLAGSVTLPPSGVWEPEQLAADTSLAVSGLELQDWLALLAASGSAPEGRGRVAADLHVAGNLAEGLTIKGGVDIQGLALSGEVLKGDTPELGEVTLRVNAQATDDGLTITDLSLASLLGNLTASGECSMTRKATLQARASLDLTAVGAHFPHSLGLREDLVVSEGMLNSAFTVISDGTAHRLDGWASLEQLSGTVQGERVAWTEPVTVALNAQLEAQAWRINRLALVSSMLRASLQGDLANMELHGVANLERVVQETGKFVDLDGWMAKGNVTLDATALTENGNTQIEGSLRAEGLQVADSKGAVVPESSVVVEAQCVLPSSGSKASKILRDLSLTWTTWLGEGSLSVARIRIPEQGGMPDVKDLVLNGTLALKPVGQLMHSQSPDSPAWQLEGSARTEIRGACRDGRWEIPPFRVVGDAMSMGVDGHMVRDDDVELSLAGPLVWGPDERSVPDVVLTLAPGRVLVTDIVIPEGPAWADTLSATLEIIADLQKTQHVYGPVLGLPADRTWSGQLNARGRVRPAADSELEVELEAELSDFRVKREDQVLLSEDKARLKGKILHRAEDGLTRIPSLTLTSSPLELDVRGSLQSTDSGGALDVSGNMKIHLAALASYLRGLLGTDIEMEGQGDRPVRIEARWTEDGGKRVMEHLVVEAGFQADRISVMGLEVTELNVPVAVDGLVASMPIRAAANGGQVDVQPSADFSLSPAKLTLNLETNLLDNVTITPELADGLLGHIHPVFAKVSYVTGKLDFKMNTFEWPLDGSAERDAVFTGTMYFRDVELKAEGPLDRILEAIKVKERNLEIGERHIDFTCSEGRIRCSPMRLRAGGHRITIDGTMGLDQSLDYVVEVPVTEELVGRDLYKYLEDVKIRVPVRGTASKPELDDQFLTKAIADVMAQGGKKALEKQIGKLFGGEEEEEKGEESGEGQPEAKESEPAPDRKGDEGDLGDMLEREAQKALEKLFGR